MKLVWSQLIHSLNFFLHFLKLTFFSYYSIARDIIYHIVVCFQLFWLPLEVTPTSHPIPSIFRHTDPLHAFLFSSYLATQNSASFIQYLLSTYPVSSLHMSKPSWPLLSLCPNCSTWAVPSTYEFLILSILVTPKVNLVFSVLNSCSSVSCVFISATISKH